MSADQWMLLAAVCAMAAVGGGLLVVRGLYPPPPDPARRTSPWVLRWRRARQTLPEAWAERYRYVTAAAALVTVVLWAYTARPVQGLLAGVAVLGFPWIWHPAGTSTRQIRRLEALADWLQQLAAVHEAGMSLEQAIRTSADRAPQALREPVGTLTARLRLNVAPKRAYRQFADALADGVVDHVVLLFLTHTQDRGAGLKEALQEMSDDVARQAVALRTVDADRAKVRTSTRWVSLFSLVISAVVLLNPAYSEPYHTGQGQLMLLILGSAFAGALIWLRKMAAGTPPPRLLNPLPDGGAAAEEPQTAAAGSPAAKGGLS